MNEGTRRGFKARSGHCKGAPRPLSASPSGAGRVLWLGLVVALSLAVAAPSRCEDRVLDPGCLDAYFANSSAALPCFSRMQEQFLAGDHLFVFDVTTIHTFSSDFRMPVDTTKPLFEEEYETGGIEHHHFILLLNTPWFGHYLIRTRRV